MARTKRIFREWQHPRASNGRFARKGSPEWVRAAAEKFRNADDGLKAGTSAPGHPGRPRIARGAKAEAALATHAPQRRTNLAPHQPVEGPARRPASTTRGKTPRSAKETAATRERAMTALQGEDPRDLKADSDARAGTAQLNAEARDQYLKLSDRLKGLDPDGAQAKMIKRRMASLKADAESHGGNVSESHRGVGVPRPPRDEYERGAQGAHGSSMTGREVWGQLLGGPQKSPLATRKLSKEDQERDRLAMQAKTAAATGAATKRANPFDDPAFAESRALANRPLAETNFAEEAEPQPVDTPRVSGKGSGVSTTTRGRPSAETKRAAMTPKLSDEQRANYDKLLGSGPGEGLVKNATARKVVEQMEQHGWQIADQSPMHRLITFKSPDGRYIQTQFLTDPDGKKPRFSAGQGARSVDMTMKTALAKVVTPHHDEVGGPNVHTAMQDLGLPMLNAGGWNEPPLVSRDSTFKPLDQAARDTSTPGGFGTPKKTHAEAAADLRKAAATNRRLADDRQQYNDNLMGGPGKGYDTDGRQAKLRQRADQFEAVANRLEEQARERQAYEAERDRRAALPLDIRPTPRSGKKAPAKKAAPKPALQQTPDPNPADLATKADLLTDAPRRLHKGGNLEDDRPSESEIEQRYAKADAAIKARKAREALGLDGPESGTMANIRANTFNATPDKGGAANYRGMNRTTLNILAGQKQIPLRERRGKSNDELAALLEAKDAELSAAKAKKLNPAGVGEPSSQHQQHTPPRNRQLDLDNLPADRGTKKLGWTPRDRDGQGGRLMTSGKRVGSQADRYDRHKNLTREQFDALPETRQRTVLDELRQVANSGETKNRTIASNRSGFHGATIRGQVDADHVAGAKAKLRELTYTAPPPIDNSIEGRAARLKAGDRYAADGTIDELNQIARAAGLAGFPASWKRQKGVDYLRNQAIAGDRMKAAREGHLAAALRDATPTEALAVMEARDAEHGVTLGDMSTAAKVLGVKLPAGTKSQRMHGLAKAIGDRAKSAPDTKYTNLTDAQVRNGIQMRGTESPEGKALLAEAKRRGIDLPKGDAAREAAAQRAHNAILNVDLDRTAKPSDTPRPGELERLNEPTLRNIAKSAPGSPLSNAATAELRKRGLDTPRDNSQNGGASNSPTTEANMTAKAKSTGEPQLGVTESSRGRTTTVTLPDGTTAQRTSKTMAYTHAVVVTEDHRGQARDLRASATESDRFADALQAWVDAGSDFSKLEKHRTANRSDNDKRNGASPFEYYLPGFGPVQRTARRSRYGGGGTYLSDEGQYGIPDPKDTIRYDYAYGDGDKVGETRFDRYGPAYMVKNHRDMAARQRKQADNLDAGPAESHHVSRWSQSLQGALGGQNEAAQVRNRRTQIVTVGGIAKAPEKPARVVPTAEEKEAAAQAKKDAEAARRVADREAFFKRVVGNVERDLAEGQDAEANLSYTDAGLKQLAKDLGVKVPRPYDKAETKRLIVEAVRERPGKAAKTAPAAEKKPGWQILAESTGSNPAPAAPAAPVSARQRAWERGQAELARRAIEGPDRDRDTRTGAERLAAQDAIQASNRALDREFPRPPRTPEVKPDLSNPAVARAQRLLDQVKTGKTIYFRAGDEWMIIGPAGDVQPGQRLTVHKADGSTTEVIVGDVKDDRTVQGTATRTATFRNAPPRESAPAPAPARPQAAPLRPAGPVDEASLRERYSRAADRVAGLDGDNLNGPRESAARRELAEARQALLDAGLPLQSAAAPRRFGSRPAQAPRTEAFNPRTATGGNLPPRREGETDGMYQVRVAPNDDAAERLLNGYTLAGLKAMARDAGIPGAASMSKTALVQALMGPRRRYWDSIALSDQR